MSSLKSFERQFNTSQEQLEQYFNQNGIDFHKNWAFSLENREMIRSLLSYIHQQILTHEGISYRNLWLFLKAYIYIQHQGRQLYHSFKLLHQNLLSSTIYELHHINQFAVGVYGSLITDLLLRRDLMKLLQGRDSLEILSEYTGIDLTLIAICKIYSDLLMQF
jgi:hypothetical protein